MFHNQVRDGLEWFHLPKDTKNYHILIYIYVICQKKNPLFFTEREGFEPSIAFTMLVFKTSAINRSAIFPHFTNNTNNNLPLIDKKIKFYFSCINFFYPRPLLQLHKDDFSLKGKEVLNFY